MKLSLLKTPVSRFLIQSLLLLLAWYAIYDLWLHPLEVVDITIIQNVSWLSKEILELLGYRVFSGGDRLLGIDGTNGVWMGDNCNGISLFALFVIIIASYPAKAGWIKKLLFILAGVLSIHFFNVLRVIGIAIGEVYAFDWTDFNHNVTFKYLMYAYIFLLWWWWVEKLSGNKTEKNTSVETDARVN